MNHAIARRLSAITATCLALIIFVGLSGCGRKEEPQKPSLYVINWRGSVPSGASVTSVRPNITAFTIESTGRLALVPGSPFPSTNRLALHGRITPDAGLLLLDAGALRRSPAGGLEPIRHDFLQADGTPVDALAIDPFARFVFGRDRSGLHSFRLNAAKGVAEPGKQLSLQLGVADSALDPLGKFLYMVNEQGTEIHVAAIDTDSGAMTAVAGSPFRVAPRVRTIRVHPSGDFLFASTVTGTTPESRIQAFRIDPVGGGLERLPVPRFPGADACALAIEPTGRFMYVAEYGNDRLWGFEIDSQGGFAPVPGSPFRTGRSPLDVAVDGNGRFVYVANSKSDNVSAFAIDPGTGALTPVAGSPFATGGEPSVLAATPRLGSPIKYVELREPQPGQVVVATDAAQPAALSASASGYDPSIWAPAGASIADLVTRLGDANWQVRYAAAVKLGQRKAAAADAVSALVHALDDDHDDVVQWSAYALGGIGRAAQAAVPRLAALLSVSGPTTRYAAAKALGEIGPDAASAVPQLVQALSNRIDGVGACAAAAEALARIHAQPALTVPAFAQAMTSTDFKLRRAALEGLKSFGAQSAVAVPQLVGLLESESYETRRFAAEALGVIGPAAGSAVPALVGAGQDPDSSVRAAAAEALFRIRKPKQ